MAVGGDRSVRSGDQSGIVEKHVDAWVLTRQPGSELPYLVKMTEVGDVAFRADLGGDRAGFAR